MTPSAEERARIRASVTEAFNGLVNAAKSLQAEPYLAYFDKQIFTALNADGTVTHSFDAFSQTYLQQIQALERYDSLVFSNVKVTAINSKTAILVNEFKADVILQSGDSLSMKGGGTQVWALQHKSWKLVSVSSSASP